MFKIQISGATGVHIFKYEENQPIINGILEHVLEIPSFDRALYVAARQKYDPYHNSNSKWYDGVNRFHPLVVDSLEDVQEGGFFIILRAKDKYLTLLALAGERTVSWFSSEHGKLIVKTGNLGTDCIKSSVPVVAWALDGDIYEACARAWEAALSCPLINYSARRREDKPYPEPFRYLGWCSWEQYKSDIDEAVIQEQIDLIEKSQIPVRYVLIDDGHLSAAGKKLTSFKPDPGKFPHGFGSLTKRKSKDKIKWMGIWLCFNGYWDGIAFDNDLGHINSHLREVGPRTLMPKGDYASASVFYDAMVGEKRRDGFDFVKVDGQSRNLRFYEGLESPVEFSRNNSKALESACSYHMEGLINCMAHNPVCIFNTRNSAVTRCSEDYIMGDKMNARRHIYNSYANILWLGQTVWGDHDMFHSSDPVSGRIMAVSKALSGGPVYLSDNPRDFNKEHILPLCYEDGELLRPLAPAAPCEQSIFTNPYDENKPFIVGAPLANMSAAVACYNLTEPEKVVTGRITTQDYMSSFGMLQPRVIPAIPAEGLIIYDWMEKCACRLEKEYAFELKGFSDKLFILSPVIKGWSVIGRTDKYLSAAAVKILYLTGRDLILEMKESGPLAIWLDEGRPVSSEASFERKQGNLWQADIKPGQRNYIVRINKELQEGKNANASNPVKTSEI